ncbi:alpha/beta-hydrolase [Cylindrobasidium torrendii FP15055 ss-10]|uniref:Alpha/beta-hydrolase n=1 Tax=Cylindrobasidium torrendii FP15055 ss-10 TaxID=1314674 RepID=A0A0D7AY72_9AGAR|nr:alpha/beta-hydrolase [Cylindrobasidium torrendii FP15055 ss-10]
MAISNLLPSARTAFAIWGGLYAIAIGLLTTPYFQRHTIYLNALRFPWGAEYHLPHKYGLSPNKTFPFQLTTSDNETLGSWFILSDDLYQSLPVPAPNPESLVSEACRQYPTILFLHGNAATRAYSARVQHYSAFTSRLHANVLAIDYRGFAESTGQPSEEGLILDARAAWDWLIEQGAKGTDILIVGHSLGTGVSANLAAQLSDENIAYRGVVLMSPFSSISELLKTYNIFGLIPLMKPLHMIPYAANAITWALAHKFDTLSAVPRIKGEVMIVHAENDWDIPYEHSEVLFNAFLEKHLPAIDVPRTPSELSNQDWSSFSAQIDQRKDAKSRLLRHTEIEHLAVVDEFTDSSRDVTLVLLRQGGHDYVGTQEGFQDILGAKFGLVRGGKHAIKE